MTRPVAAYLIIMVLIMALAIGFYLVRRSRRIARHKGRQRINLMSDAAG